MVCLPTKLPSTNQPFMQVNSSVRPMDLSWELIIFLAIFHGFTFPTKDITPENRPPQKESN